MNKSEWKASAKSILTRAWGLISRNLLWKILSIVFAVMLWSYVISADSSITRTKSIGGVDVTVSGLSVLQSRGLAVLMDTVDQLPDVRVRVEVPQSSFSRVTADTVSVELDMSRVRQAGRQEVELIGTTTYGEVVQVIPGSLEVTIEALDSRTVPVNVTLTGQDEETYYYTVNSRNPAQLTISGASSVVQRIAQAQAVVDVSSFTASRSVAVPFTLLDSEGSELTQMLTRSTSSVTVNLSINPIAVLPVSDSLETAVTGTPETGYRITRVEVQPEVITVAGDASLLAGLDSLSFEPVDVSGRTQSFSTVASVNALDDMKYISSKQVTVTVYIEEMVQVARFEDVPVTVAGLADGMKAALSEQAVQVKATGGYTAVSNLTGKALRAAVDVTGLAEGTYDLPVTVTTDNNPDVTFEAEPLTIRVVVSRAGQEG